ncbi:hypothetical protein [Paenibacillus oleatilyticus]|uniref:hypothetical protein n=1 Tax=Paenibacillus oleatilyticus TaxID=2594886 RepID=UPI001C1F6BB1|nr:hypothetical protein [Paenibacillus oleatilyticus]MBU7318622.1 hypothetical protein [Paenibacillus oleatilyticus]
MKEAIVVDLNGFMTEVTLVADDVTGVFPMFKPHQITESTEELQQSSPEIIGYIIAIAVPSGLYKPKFDFNAWELYNKLLDPEMDGKNRNSIYPQELNLWVEGRTHSIQSAATEKNLTFTEKMKNKHQQLVSIYKRLLK